MSGITLPERARLAAANCINQTGALACLLRELAEALDSSEADALIKGANLEQLRAQAGVGADPADADGVVL